MNKRILYKNSIDSNINGRVFKSSITVTYKYNRRFLFWNLKDILEYSVVDPDFSELVYTEDLIGITKINKDISKLVKSAKLYVDKLHLNNYREVWK